MHSTTPCPILAGLSFRAILFRASRSCSAIARSSVAHPAFAERGTMGAVGLADHSARAAGPLPTRPFQHRLSARSVSCALPLCHLQTASTWHFASRALAYLSRPRPCATGVHAVPPLAAGGRATCASFCAYVAGTHGTVHSTPWQLPLLPAALQHSGSQRTIAVQRSQPPYTKVYHSFSPT
jgi:hypothetical protein